MIFDASEAIQLLVLAACFALTLVKALRMRNSVWIEVVCFFACMLLGNVYYFGYTIVFGDSPHYSYIADLGWIAGYIFLLMLLVECEQGRGITSPSPVAWIPVAACAVCCVYYIAVNGYPVLNIADNGLMAALGFFAVRGLVASPKDGTAKSFASNRALHIAVLAFVVVEQALWLSSLISEPRPGFDAYTIINYALTLSYVIVLACAWRSDEL